MNQIERRVQKMNLDFLIQRELKAAEREKNCTEHKDASGEIKPWFRGVNYCFSCGKNIREVIGINENF